MQYGKEKGNTCSFVSLLPQKQSFPSSGKHAELRPSQTKGDRSSLSIYCRIASNTISRVFEYL